MSLKLVIAGIKWVCHVPEGILQPSILSFAEEFSGTGDIELKIVENDSVSIPQGVPITKQVLEWYKTDGYYEHQLMKAEHGRMLVSLKANGEWSDILIEISSHDQLTIDFINVILLEVVFRNRLLFHDGLVLHSSSIEYNGEAVAFSAPSGTGKSTHARLWQEMHHVRIINDDHPAIRRVNGKTIIYGTPWAGECQKFHNMSCDLKAIVILEQGNRNQIWRLDGREMLRDLLPRYFLPYHSSELLQRAAKIITEIISSTTVYKLVCRPDEEAVTLVKRSIWSDHMDHRKVSYE